MLAVLTAKSVANCGAAGAQVFFAPVAVASSTRGSGDEKPVSSFTLPTQTNDVKEAIEEFQRFSEHEAWEKAFKSLETIKTKSTNGFVERPDGVLVPSQLLVRSLLAGLPPEGKAAYRVFYDAQAMALWEKAKGPAELDSLSSLVDNHLVSSVGDRAADRLGDLYFERGDYDRAIGAWRSVLAYCPDTQLSKGQLLIKIATALTLASRPSQLGEIERAIEERYAGDTVVVGGRQTTAGEEFARLTADVERDAPKVEVALPDDIDLPTSNDLLWQYSYQTKDNPANPGQPFALMDVYGRMRPNDFPIPAATDGQRVYLNIFGIEMAFDAVTGKMLWRTGRLHELNFQQNRQGAMPERYTMAVDGDRTWSVTRDPKQLNQHPPVFALVAREAATGKEVFNSRRMLSTWSIIGAPFLARNAAISQTTSPDRVASSTGRNAPPSGKPVLDFSKGFSDAAAQMSLNGNAAIADARLRLTDGGPKQASSVFSTKPVSVAAFKTEFEFQLTKAFADGILFILQGDGPRAVGGWANGRNGITFEGINKSVGVKFDIYGEDANSTGLCLDGVPPTADTAVSLKGSKIDLKSGHVFRVNMVYDGQDLRVVITDTKTQAQHATSYAVDIADHVGSAQAYVGFAGSSGLLTAVQEVMNWTYTPMAPAPKKAAPPPSDDVIYVGASHTNNGREMSLLVLDAKDGKLLKTVKLGTHVVDPNQVYYDRTAEPTFLLAGDRLYVDTHAGALVALRPRTGAIDWGIMYESPPPQTGYNYYGYLAPQYGVSGPTTAAGVLFAKGMRSPRLIGVQPEGPTLAWNRPVDAKSVLVGADDKCLYLGGDELLAYSLESQELLWATQLPQSAAWSMPLLTKDRIYQFTSRGIYEVDKQTGRVVKLFRGVDLDALGGTLLVTPEALVTVSNLAVTAYPLHASSPNGTDRTTDSSNP